MPLVNEANRWEEGFQITAIDAIRMNKLEQINLSLDFIGTPLRDYYYYRELFTAEDESE